MPVQPAVSYVVWHTQRTGSTLLCTTLEATGVAGYPQEWPESRLAGSTAHPLAVREKLWSEQTTRNSVLGVKWCFYEPWVEDFFRLFAKEASGSDAGRTDAWESVFPNCRHIMMTRHDKVALAVSWWKMISGGQGHLSSDGSPLPWQETVPTAPADLADAYDFAAIKALIDEQAQREAGLRELLEILGVAPLTIVYEDFIRDYERTVRRVLDYLGLGDAVQDIPPPLLARTSDQVDEEWVERFLSGLNTDSQ